MIGKFYSINILLHAAFLLPLFFDLKDGDSMFTQNES